MGHTNVPLFGLAPDGVYPATVVTNSAVRSYRTISPLPPLQAMMAVYFLRHFPSARAAQALPGIPPYGARTFLHIASDTAIAWLTSSTSLSAPHYAGKHSFLHLTFSCHPLCPGRFFLPPYPILSWPVRSDRAHFYSHQ